MKRTIKLRVSTSNDGKECGRDCPYIRTKYVDRDCQVFGDLKNGRRSAKYKSREVKE